MRSSLLLFALLAGCASKPLPPVEVVRTVYCLTPDQYGALVKAKPAKVGQTLTGNAQKDFKIVVGKDILLEKYADGLLGVLGSCTK